MQRSSLMSSHMFIETHSSQCQSTFIEFDAVSESYVKDLIMKCKPTSCCFDPSPTIAL